MGDLVDLGDGKEGRKVEMWGERGRGERKDSRQIYGGMAGEVREVNRRGEEVVGEVGEVGEGRREKGYLN